WFPYAFAVAGSDHADQLYARVLTGYARVTFVLCLGFVLFAREAVVVLAGAEYLDAAGLLGLIGGAAIIAGLPYVFNIGLLLQKRTGYYGIAVGLSSLVTIAAGWGRVAVFGRRGGTG